MFTQTENWGTERGDTFNRHTSDAVPTVREPPTDKQGSTSLSSSSSSTNMTISSSGVTVQRVPKPRPALPKGTELFYS